MSVPLRDLRSYVAQHAENAAPMVRSGLYESVEEFLAMTELYAAADPVPEVFEPSAGNDWVREGFAAAVAYLSTAGGVGSEYPATLAVYVEGDVTSYRFRWFEEATCAGRLWAVGLI